MTHLTRAEYQVQQQNDCSKKPSHCQQDSISWMPSGPPSTLRGGILGLLALSLAAMLVAGCQRTLGACHGWGRRCERLVGALIPPDRNDGKNVAAGALRWRCFSGGVILGSAFHIAYAGAWLTHSACPDLRLQMLSRRRMRACNDGRRPCKARSNNTNEIMATVISGQILSMHARNARQKKREYRPGRKSSVTLTICRTAI